MRYSRVVQRNRLEGDYRPAHEGMADAIGLICGDLRRLEKDTQDDDHIRGLAVVSGATEDQVRVILKTFFDGSIPIHYKPSESLMERSTDSLTRAEIDALISAGDSLSQGVFNGYGRMGMERRATEWLEAAHDPRIKLYGDDEARAALPAAPLQVTPTGDKNG